MTTAIGRHRLSYDVRDHQIGASLFLDGAWQDRLVRLLPAYRLEGTTAIDVGASVGIFTLPLADAVGPDGRVLAFEPNPRLLRLLYRNLERAGTTNVTVIESAVSNSSSPRRLVVPPHDFGAAHLDQSEDAGGIQVEVTTLDAVTSEFPAGSVGFLKIDVEGGERDVLDGATETLDRNPSLILQLEICGGELGGSPRRTIEMLLARGFAGYEITSHRVLPINPGAFYDAPMFRGTTDLVLSRKFDAVGPRMLEILGSIAPLAQ